jgi:hypothetical protein
MKIQPFYLGAVLLLVWNCRAPAAVLYVDLNNPSPSPPYTSWSTAAQNIQDAVDAANPGDLILVTNGIYQNAGQVDDYYGNDLTNRVLIDQPLTVQSVNGPAVTIILGNPTNDATAVRCVNLADGATLSGFTLKNGGTAGFTYWGWATGNTSQQSGGGVVAEGPNSVVTNCIIMGCSAYYYGGGAINGILKNCTLTNNSSGYQGGGVVSSVLQNCSLLNNQSSGGGGGAEGGALTNCVLSGNSAQWNGGGAEGSALVNCALAGNTAQGSGGGLAGGAANNCTFTANIAQGSGGGAGGGTLNNCITSFNTSPNGANFSFGTVLNFCCTMPLPDDGTNNFAADPQLLDSAHVKADSPCIGAGSATYTSGADFDGEAWANPPSVGCDEFYSGAGTGPLAAAIQTGFTKVAANFPAGFTGIMLGHATNVQWNFGDGTFSTNQLFVSHIWTVPENYQVVLTAFNDDHSGGISATTLVQVVTQPVFYVDAGNANPSAPFNSWATAATNIQDAVAAVTEPGSLVLVTNGVYQFGGRFANGSLTNRVAVTTPMLVQSVNGAAATIIAGNPVIGDNAARCVYLANGAMLDGFTLTNGATRSGGDVTMENSGGGIRCESANTIVYNCAIAGNLAYNFGGGIEGGTILNSTIFGNSASSGGGAHGAGLSNCNFWLNSASGNGGGAESCVVNNSVLTANTGYGSGGAAGNSALFNCTASGNDAGVSGGGANNSTLNNCIVYFNSSPVGTNFFDSILNFSCTTPLPSVGANNITADPQLTDSAHIGGSSTCIGAGNFNVANGADIDGEAWANPPSIGCDEFYAGPVTTSLAVTAMANYTNVSVGFPVSLSGLISGHATTSSWNFGDSTIASNQIYTAHSWSLPGDYAVTFTAFNDANPSGVSATVAIHVTSQTVFYVDANGTNPVAPFSSWTTAATNIQDAADVACAGGTILVNDGLYQFGGSVVFGLLTNRVALTRPMNLQSVHGAAATLIAGNPVNDDTAVRGVLLANGCTMTGFTVTNGATRGAGDVNLEQSGGGAWCESANVLVSNCIFAANYVPQCGGGAMNGTFENCAFANNSAGSSGGGNYGGVLNDCTFTGNYGGSAGGGADSSTLNHCTLTGNSCSSSGGGANACVLNNCLIATNSIGWGDGGGVSGSVLSNCDLIANASPITGGGAEGSTLSKCRLIGNWAGDEGGGGGGADHCTLTGCVLSDNYISSYGGGASDSTLNDCTLTNNSCSSDGGGAYNCILSNCILTGNSAGQYGGGACVSTVNNCALSANTAGKSGGGYSGISGVYFGRGNSLSNCVVFGNSASQNGGGAESCIAVNCTVTGNSASQSGGGADNSTLANCIVYYNSAMTGSNYFGGTLNYCCTLPLPPVGSGNITKAPQLADFAHISAGSPCRGEGSAIYSGGVDIDGEAWLNPPSIGCDEFYSGSATGALVVSISEGYTNCASGFVVNFLGQITGHAASCVWDFGDGTIVSNQLYFAHSWAGGGDYTVTLTAFSDSNPGGVSASVVVQVMQNPVYYVSLSSTNPISPFDSWATAATNIQDAVDAAVVGGTVLVTNGDYNAGGRVVFGAMTNRVAVNKPLTVRSVNGPTLTAIEGFATNDSSSIRCVYLTNDAALVGFTLTNGATSNGGDGVHEWSGGGVWCESSSVVVSNCIFVNNSAGGYGGGAYGGTLFNCSFTNNYAYDGGAACFSSLNHCTLANNRGYYGGGAYGSTLLDSKLTGNFTYVDSDYTANGGGASGCTLTNCILTGNSSLSGGGAAGCTLVNCLLTGNTGGGSYFGGAGGADGSTLINCTVVGNTADNHGGVRSCVLTNCIVYFNTASSGTNYADDSSFYYCDTTPLPMNGANNIAANPLFADSEHISSASPCRGAGSASATSGVDIDGDPWLNPPSIGCDEFNSASATGALAVAMSETFTNVATGFGVDFAAQVIGHAAANRWDFGDGTIVSNQLAFSHSWSAPGNYAVTFTAFNSDNPAGVSAPVTIFVLQNPVHYVSLGNTTPVAPYLSWATAATNIQDAIDAAFAGGTVLVTNGIYQTGSRVLNGSTNRVVVMKPMTLQSANGAGVTVIDGGNLVRCLYLADLVSVDGFTLQKGTEVNGGGVLCQSGGDVLNDCVLAGNSSVAGGSGGGAESGIMNRCKFTGNSADYAGGGAESSTLNQCILVGNAAGTYGGGADSSLLNNCVLTNNRTGTTSVPSVGQSNRNKPTPLFIVSNFGGGAANSALNDCLLAGNTSDDGGGAYSGTANSCLFINNSANFAGGAESSTLNNCTLVGNSAWENGGGTYGSTLNNCIAYFNTNNDYSASTLNYCCTASDPGGMGNITNAPLFVNLAGDDFHLQTNSPCINAGNNAYVSVTNDFDGNPRIVGGTVDIGAYEFQTPVSIISYAWLQQYGLSTDGSVDYLDSDGTGMNNWQKWIAGLNPTNPASVLAMMTPVSTKNSTGVIVSWQSVNNRTYYLQRSTNLTTQPAFSAIQSNIVGQAGTTSFTDTTATNGGPFFYRVGVQ